MTALILVLLLRQMFFYINMDKSVLVPTQCIEYLGNLIDSQAMVVKLPLHRIEKLFTVVGNSSVRPMSKSGKWPRLLAFSLLQFQQWNLGSCIIASWSQEKLLLWKLTKVTLRNG